MSDQFIFSSPALQLPITCHIGDNIHQSLLFLADGLFDFKTCLSINSGLSLNHQKEQIIEKMTIEEINEDNKNCEPENDLFGGLSQDSNYCLNSDCFPQTGLAQHQISQCASQVQISLIQAQKSNKSKNHRFIRKLPFSNSILKAQEHSSKNSKKNNCRVTKEANLSSSLIISPLQTKPIGSRGEEASLSNLSKIVYDIIKQQKSVNFKQIYQMLIEKISSYSNRTFPPSSMKRRVYDIVNVLESSGLARRGDAKTVYLVDEKESKARKEASVKEIRMQVKNKREALKQKCRQIILLAQKTKDKDFKIIDFCNQVIEQMQSKVQKYR